MSRIRLKTKLVLAISGMVVALVVIFSYVYVSKIVRSRTSQASDTAEFVAKEMRERSGDATHVDPAELGVDPGDANAVAQALEHRLQKDPGMNSLLNSIVGYSTVIYDAAIVDKHGRAIAHTTSAMVNRTVDQRESFYDFRNASFLKQIEVVYGSPRVYDLSLPIYREGQHFGDIRVGISTVFLKSEIQPQLTQALAFSSLAILVSLILAAGLSNIALRPLEAIGRRLDLMTAGVPDAVSDPDPKRIDEYGLVNTKIDRLGRQIKDVKEVFSALKENLDQIMGTLQDGLMLFTRDSRVVLVSASAERFVGRPRADILGRSVEAIFNDTTKLGQIVLDAFALHQQLPQREIELESGRRVQIALDFISERGERIGALLTMRDAESVYRIENEIELSRRMASIGRLTSGVAHEVKNPINAIVVHLELLREKMKQADSTTRRHMEVIDSEIHRLDRVVQTLIDFNRPVELRLSDFDLRRVAEDVCALAAPDAARQGVKIEAQIGSTALPVRADADLIKQALLNVVLNGVQAMDNGGVLTIATRSEARAVAIEVRDQGKGISPDIRDRIFNLYFTTKEKGSGIGLAMSYRALQLHNGSLEYQTEMGKGTTFRLFLPLAGAKEQEVIHAVTRT